MQATSLSALRTGAATIRPENIASTDFTAHLPASAQLPDLVQTVQQECASVGVQLQGMQAKAQTLATDTALGRSELVLHLRGSYAGVRQVLVDTLQRHAHVTVSALKLRHADSSAGIEATATLAVWTRPLAPPSLPLQDAPAAAERR